MHIDLVRFKPQPSLDRLKYIIIKLYKIFSIK